MYSMMLLLLTSCARSCQALDRDIQTGSRHNIVIMYSGGDTVFHDEFDGIINNSQGSDGVYYYKGDTLVEISGDYVHKSTK
jgi:hypothetical protein